MTWFRIDDHFWSHPKTLDLSGDAIALWVRAGSYSGCHLTDGFVAESILPMLQGDHDVAGELCRAGLWKKVKGGYAFHQWFDYQDTKDVVEHRRDVWRNQKRNQRRNTVPIKEPFLSKGWADSGRDSTTESTVDKAADPEVIANTVAQLRSVLGGER
jgi:hypothetical protein